MSATHQQEQGGHISHQRLWAHMDLCSPPPPPPPPLPDHEACPGKGRVQDQPHRAGERTGKSRREDAIAGSFLNCAETVSSSENEDN